MSGPRKHDYLPIIGKLHEEYFGSEEKQRIAKRLAEERATANAEIAYRFANLAMPEDIRSRAKAWRLEAFCEVLWNNAFQAGFREATRTPDPAQIRADAIREAAALPRYEPDYTDQLGARSDMKPDAHGDWISAASILALLTTPLSPTAVDGSPAPDAGGNDPRDEQIARLVEALTLASNRLAWASIQFDTGTQNFITVGEWADDALAAAKGGDA